MKHTFDTGTKEKRLVWLNANPEPQPRTWNEREESKVPPEAQKSIEKKDAGTKPTDTRGIGNWVYENTVGAGKRANEQMQGAVDATIKFGKDAGAGAMQQINGTFESIGTKAAEARNAVLSKVGGNIKKSATETWESAKATAGKARELGKSAIDSAKGKINEFNTKANADKPKTEASKAPAPKPTDAPKPKTETPAPKTDAPTAKPGATPSAKPTDAPQTPAAGKTEKPAAPKPGTETPKPNPKDGPKPTTPEAGKPAPAAAAEGQKEGDPKTNKDSLEKSMKDFSNKLKEAKTPEEKMTAFLGLLTALIAYMHSSMHGELDKPVEKKTDAAGKTPEKTADEKKTDKAEDRVQKEVEAGTKPETVAEMKKKTADLKEKKTAEKKSNTELIDGYDKDTKAKTEENKSLETKRSELNGKQNLLPATATEAEKTQITNAIKEIDDKIGVNKKAIETAKGEKTKLLDRNKVLDEDLGVLDKQEKTLNSSVSKIKSVLEEAKDNLKIDGVKNNIDWKDVYLKIDGTIVIEQPNDPFMTYINKIAPELKKDEEGKLLLSPDSLANLLAKIEGPRDALIKTPETDISDKKDGRSPEIHNAYLGIAEIIDQFQGGKTMDVGSIGKIRSQLAHIAVLEKAQTKTEATPKQSFNSVTSLRGTHQNWMQKASAMPAGEEFKKTVDLQLRKQIGAISNICRFTNGMEDADMGQQVEELLRQYEETLQLKNTPKAPENKTAEKAPAKKSDSGPYKPPSGTGY